MKKQVCIYNPQILLSIVQEYLQEQNDWALFNNLKLNSDGLLMLKTEEDRILYYKHDERATRTWFALVNACDLVDADFSTVMATVKAMNRYEKRRKWAVRARLPVGYSYEANGDGEERIRRYWANPDPETKHFTSTGRRKP